MEGSTALISIHPVYAEKILSGEKRLEFRRRWTTRKVSFLVIYATSPIKRIVAVAEVGEVFRGSKALLWELAKKNNGGISRRKLFEYMEGAPGGVALELSRVRKADDGIELGDIFGPDFLPPQSFRYLSSAEIEKLASRLGDEPWE